MFIPSREIREAERAVYATPLPRPLQHIVAGYWDPWGVFRCAIEFMHAPATPVHYQTTECAVGGGRRLGACVTWDMVLHDDVGGPFLTIFYPTLQTIEHKVLRMPHEPFWDWMVGGPNDEIQRVIACQVPPNQTEEAMRLIRRQLQIRCARAYERANQ